MENGTSQVLSPGVITPNIILGLTLAYFFVYFYIAKFLFDIRKL
jgi:hypothetical protein